MELKPGCVGVYLGRCSLLIVPYGIETYLRSFACRMVKLLIVPYGIETLQGRNHEESCQLLIVPYGIETC